MVVYKTKTFSRWAAKVGIADSDLFVAANEVAIGVVEASLGQHLFKKRVARYGQGKSGSYRTVIAYCVGKHSFYLFGFDKGSRSNVNANEMKALGKMSKEFMKYGSTRLIRAVDNGALIEVKKP